MKKVITVLMATILFVTLSMSAYAAFPETAIPFWSNISTLETLITFIDTDGTAKGTLTAKSGTTSITGTLTVYKQTTGGEWEYIGSDNDTVSGRYLSLLVDFYGESGVYYKAVFTVSVTRNGTVESETKTSFRTC